MQGTITTKVHNYVSSYVKVYFISVTLILLAIIILIIMDTLLRTKISL